MKWVRIRIVCLVLTMAAGTGCDRSPAGSNGGGGARSDKITCYRLRAPGDAYDIEQASDLHYGRLGDWEGLWAVCDRNGGRSAGHVYFISEATLSRAAPRSAVIADEAFTIVPPEGEWSAFAEAHRKAGPEVLAEMQRRIGAGRPSDAPQLDLEAVTIAPSPTPPHEPRVFAVAEEPFSTVLELVLEGAGATATARLAAVYAYQEADNEHGTDRNDGLEGLAYGGQPGAFYWAEEGTAFHNGPPGPTLFFLNPRLGRARLEGGQVVVEPAISDRLTAAVRSQRQSSTQTLNAVTVTPDGRLLAVDRNGGWILRIDPHNQTASRWLNLYDVDGTSLRTALADFPGERRLPYISIEGIAMDLAGTLWLVDDPAMPEAFRASCLVRITGLNTE